MKKILIVLLGFIINSCLAGQEIRLSIAPTSNVFNKSSIGDDTWDSQAWGLSTGIDYLFFIKDKLGFGVGLGFQKSRTNNMIQTEPFNYFLSTEKIYLLTISLKSKYNISKIFYLSLDPLIDFHLNYDPLQITDNQSGLGLSSGIGGNFKLNNLLYFNVEPRLWMHNIVPFHNFESPFRLSVVGINLGLVLAYKNT